MGLLMIYSPLFISTYVDEFNVNLHLIMFLFSFVIQMIWIVVWLFKIYPPDYSGDWKCDCCGAEFDTDKVGNITLLN